MPLPVNKWIEQILFQTSLCTRYKILCLLRWQAIWVFFCYLSIATFAILKINLNTFFYHVRPMVSHNCFGFHGPKYFHSIPKAEPLWFLQIWQNTFLTASGEGTFGSISSTTSYTRVLRNAWVIVCNFPFPSSLSWWHGQYKTVV